MNLLLMRKLVFYLFLLLISVLYGCKSSPVYPSLRETVTKVKGGKTKQKKASAYKSKKAQEAAKRNEADAKNVKPTSPATHTNKPDASVGKNTQENNNTPDRQKQTHVDNSHFQAIIARAKSYMGTPHKIGGLDKSGIDCSGLVYRSFQEIGVELPRTSREQALIGKEIDKKQLQPCDLVFFSYPGGTRITHVGMVSRVVSPQQIYFIHTSTSRGVIEDNLFADYWRDTYIKARRIVDAD
jgi:cell wall-associated NlpC family hydrolase